MGFIYIFMYPYPLPPHNTHTHTLKTALISGPFERSLFCLVSEIVQAKDRLYTVGGRQPQVFFFFLPLSLNFQGSRSTSWSAAGPQASPITHCERWTPQCLLTPNQMIFHKQATSDVKWNLPACSIPGLFLWTLYQFPNRVQSLTDNVCVDWGRLLGDSKGPWERPRSRKLKKYHGPDYAQFHFALIYQIVFVPLMTMENLH